LGTAFWGKADPKGHPQYGQSYVTTEWFVVFFIPIIPIGTMRIAVVDRRFLYLVVYASRTMEYVILERLPLNWKQVLATLGITWIPAALFAFWIYAAMWILKWPPW